MAKWKNKGEWWEKSQGTWIFKNQKYDEYATGDAEARMGRTQQYYMPADPSDSYAEQKHMLISFKHVPSGRAVFFKAFITAFNESYNCDWSRETIYGRTDPVMLFKNNERAISLNFKVPAYSESEAYENLGRVQTLTQFLYPSYKNLGGSNSAHAQTIAQSPLIRLKVMNLLANQNGTPGAAIPDQAVYQKQQSAFDMFENYMDQGIATQDDGLLGAITSFQINHNLENTEGGAFEFGLGTVLPKLLDVTVQFSPLHEHTVGWIDDKPINAAFPYGVHLKDNHIPEDPYVPNPIVTDTEEEVVPDQAYANAVADSAETFRQMESAKRDEMQKMKYDLHGYLDDALRDDSGMMMGMYNAAARAFNDELAAMEAAGMDIRGIGQVEER